MYNKYLNISFWSEIKQIYDWTFPTSQTRQLFLDRYSRQINRLVLHLFRKSLNLNKRIFNKFIHIYLN